MQNKTYSYLFPYSNDFISLMKKYLASSQYRYIYNPKFIFLCGKGYNKDPYAGSNRDIIDAYIRKKNPSIFKVLSEDLWDNSFQKNIDLLTFEEFLAAISDYVILFVESPGSACELGAFTHDINLFKDKLWIILDNKYKNDDSFINNGPIAKAKKENSQIIYANLEGALLSSRSLLLNIDDMIKKMQLKNRYLINNDQTKVNLKSFIIEILELIRLLQPINKNNLLDIYKNIKNFKSFHFVKQDGNYFHKEIKVDYVYKLLQKTGLLQEKNQFFVLKNELCYLDNELGNFNLMFDFPSMRSFSSLRNTFLSKKYKYKEI